MKINPYNIALVSLSLIMSVMSVQAGSPLDSQVAALQTQVKSLQSQVAALQANNALKLAPFISVDFRTNFGVLGPIITIQGANVQIVSGTGHTNVTNGLGNLIIGYDEIPPNGLSSSTARGGSHNLVIGRYNQFSEPGFGNLVCGETNTATGEGGFVAGYENQTSNKFNSILGGAGNSIWGNTIVEGNYSTICGGEGNAVTGVASIILGGYYNREHAAHSVTLGGYNNEDTTITPQYSINP